MKVIVILPVKNEEWILNETLKNFSSFADQIIIADQRSTDKTREICSRFEKVKIIENPYEGHSNKVRWLLLDEARKIKGKKLFICLDADEFISPNFIKEIKNIGEKSSTPIAFSSLWLQLYDDGKKYRVDYHWKTNKKEFAWTDDGTVDCQRTEVINDQTSRIPTISTVYEVSYPILHLQYLAQKRCEIKQAWYMCQEILKGVNPKKINNQYSVAKFNNSVKLDNVKAFWFENVEMPNKKIFDTYDNAKLHEILELFTKNDIRFFEPLDIWHIKELEDIFIKELGRKPKPEIFPSWLITLNSLKNKIKNGIIKGRL